MKTLMTHPVNTYMGHRMNTYKLPDQPAIVNNDSPRQVLLLQYVRDGEGQVQGIE